MSTPVAWVGAFHRGRLSFSAHDGFYRRFRSHSKSQRGVFWRSRGGASVIWSEAWGGEDPTLYSWSCGDELPLAELLALESR